MFGCSWRYALALCAVALMGGCASSKEATSDGRPGGFLPDGRLMRPGDVGEPARHYTVSNTGLYIYTRMILEPVTLWTGPYSALIGVPPAQQKQLADAFYAELHHVASQLCEMVAQASPGTMLVRFALVDPATPDPLLHTISATTPQEGLPEAIAGAPFSSGIGLFTASAIVRGYALDASTGAILWQTDANPSSDPEDARPLSSWRDVDFALKSWAAKFGNWMSLIGACS